MIYKAPNRVTVFDELTNFISINFLKVFFAKEDEQACSILFETKDKETFLQEKNVYTFNTRETDDKIIKHEAFYWV